MMISRKVFVGIILSSLLFSLAAGTQGVYGWASINVVSPKDDVIYSGSIPLEFEARWESGSFFVVNSLNYSIDGIPTSPTVLATTGSYGNSNPSMATTYAKMTIDISNLTNGEHKLRIWYELMLWGKDFEDGSFYIPFNVYNPNLHILSPQNKTYALSSIPMNFTIDETGRPLWVRYNVDNIANVTVIDLENLTLPLLPEGSHALVVSASDSSGVVIQSDTVYFTINLTIPSPSPSPTPSPSQTPTLSPSPSIPELSSWIILSVAAIATITAVFTVRIKKMNRSARE